MKSALVLVVLLASGYSSMTSASIPGMGWVVTVIAGPTSAEGDAAG